MENAVVQQIRKKIIFLSMMLSMSQSYSPYSRKKD